MTATTAVGRSTRLHLEGLAEELFDEMRQVVSQEGSFDELYEVYVDGLEHTPLGLLARVLLETSGAIYAQSELDKPGLSRDDRDAYLLLVGEYNELLGRLMVACRDHVDSGLLVGWLIQAADLATNDPDVKDLVWSRFNGVRAEVFAIDLIGPLVDELRHASTYDDLHHRRDLECNETPTGVRYFQIKSKRPGHPVAEYDAQDHGLLIVNLDLSAAEGFRLSAKYTRTMTEQLRSFLNGIRPQ